MGKPVFTDRKPAFRHSEKGNKFSLCIIKIVLAFKIDLIQGHARGGERLQGPWKDSHDMCDQHAVIRYADTLLARLFNAILHFPPIEHTAPAMDDNRVFRNISGITSTSCPFKLDIFTCHLTNPTGDFYRTDVIGLKMVSAALYN